MSVNATTAAKRRRAGNIVNTQLFKSNDAPIQNTIQRRTMQQSNSPQIPQTPQTSAPANIQQQPPSQGQAQPIEQSSIGQRPMSLQQVISVFDKRLLTIEGHILNNKPIESVNQVVSQQPSVDFEQLKSEIDNNFQNQFSEFDHRYELLAIEITNLKEIILKLQSYTLDVNKTLMEDREQLVSKLEVKEQDTQTDDIVESEPVSAENISFDIVANSETSEISQTIDTNPENKDDEIVAESQNVAEEIIEQIIEQNEEQIIETSEITDVPSEKIETEDVTLEENNDEEKEDLSQKVDEIKSKEMILQENIPEQEEQEEEEQKEKTKRKRKQKKTVAVDF